MSSSAHVDNKGKVISILDEGPTQGLDDTTLTAEAKYPINFTQSEKQQFLFCKCYKSISIQSKKLLCTVFR